jgi:hypothetical protein
MHNVEGVCFTAPGLDNNPLCLKYYKIWMEFLLCQHTSSEKKLKGPIYAVLEGEAILTRFIHFSDLFIVCVVA